MSTVDEAQALLSRMTPGEKAQLLQPVAQESRDAYPGIDTIDDLLHLYPGLRVEDFASAWAYVRSHQDEIDRQIRDNESA